MSKKENTAKKTEIIADMLGERFLRIARDLRELQDERPDTFLEVAELSGLGRRKAYALVRIARQFGDVPEKRLYLVGWTKLQVVGRHLTDDNKEYLLQLAEENTVHDLEIILRGETPIEDARVVQLYLAPNDHKRLRSALIKHGAIPSGNGLVNVEAAVMALVEKAETAA